MRGGLFDHNQSSTWDQNNVTSNGTFHLALEENLGYTGNGLYGYDTIALGWQGSNGPSLDQQIVAGIATPDFYYGVFGLDPRPTNFTDFSNPVPSYLSNLRKQNLILLCHGATQLGTSIGRTRCWEALPWVATTPPDSNQTLRRSHSMTRIFELSLWSLRPLRTQLILPILPYLRYLFQSLSIRLFHGFIFQ